MVQGTSSGAGKSVLVTALCRIFKQDGFKVAPFKAQNMAYSWTAPDGSVMGRAQAIQAEAAQIEPEVAMNPVLLKPTSDTETTVFLMGKPLARVQAVDYAPKWLEVVLPVIRDAICGLQERFDVVVIEGAGSPAEVNLRDRDIANMRVAHMAQAPVLLVADIDRGGALASIVGTMELLTPQERDRIAGFVINKFRGDPGLLSSGLELIEARTSKPVVGVIPYFSEALVEEEDALKTWRHGPSVEIPPEGRQQNYDKLARLVRDNLDMAFVYSLISAV